MLARQLNKLVRKFDPQRGIDGDHRVNRVERLGKIVLSPSQVERQVPGVIRGEEPNRDSRTPPFRGATLNYQLYWHTANRLSSPTGDEAEANFVGQLRGFERRHNERWVSGCM